MRPRRYKLRLFWQRVLRNEFAQLRVPSFARRSKMMSLLPPIQGRGRRMAPGRDVVAGGERRVQTEYAKKNNQKSKSRLVGLLKSRPLSASGQQAFVAQRTKHEVRPSIRKHWCPALDAVAPTPERLPRAPQGAPRGCCHGAFFAGEALAASRPQRAVHAGPLAPRGPHENL